jgi:hypothetical protein
VQPLGRDKVFRDTSPFEGRLPATFHAATLSVTLILPNPLIRHAFVNYEA